MGSANTGNVKSSNIVPVIIPRRRENTVLTSAPVLIEVPAKLYIQQDRDTIPYRGFCLASVCYTGKTDIFPTEILAAMYKWNRHR